MAAAGDVDEDTAKENVRECPADFEGGAEEGKVRDWVAAA
jgi:hypothetical protein